MATNDIVLAVHVASGTAGLLLGPLIMGAPKRRGGRHTRLGAIYHWNMLIVALTAAAMALAAWDRLWWFLPIAVFSYANALVGYLAVKRKWRGWLQEHIAGMGGSYIALVTALLVVNLGTESPLAWVAPTLIGTPLIAATTARVRRGPLRRLATR